MNRHTSLAATTMLAPLPVVLVSAACTKASLRARKQENEEAFAKRYKESLGDLYDSIDVGEGDELIRTISTIAWAGVVSSNPPRLSLSIRSSRLLFSLAEISGHMMVYPICESFVNKADFCGVKSGRDMDKFKECGFDTYDLEGDKEKPVFAGAPIVLCVKIEQSLDLDSHELFISLIEDVLLHDKLIYERGKVHLEEARLVSYAHGEYYGMGGCLGFFGFSVAAPEVLERRMPKSRKI